MRIDLAVWRRRLPLVAAALLFAAGNLAVFLTYRSSTETRRAALEARRDQLKRSVEAQEADSARVTGQRERLGGVSAAMETFYGKRIGRERETLAPVVAEVHEILKEAGVAAPQISFATTPVLKLPIVQMRVAFAVHCDYPRFKRLLRAFEASKAWLVVRDISINRDSSQPGQVQVQIELVTYFAEREEPGAPEKPAPGKAGDAAKSRGARPRPEGRLVATSIGQKLGSRRQAILFAVLAVVLLLAVVRWGPGGGAAAPAVSTAAARPKPGGDPSGDEAPSFAGRGKRSAAVKEVNPDDVPALDPRDFETGKPRAGAAVESSRDLFGLADPTKRPVPTPTPAPPAPGDVRFMGPLPPPPPTPTPRPPDVSFKFLGTFGPKDHPIAVVQQGDQVMNVRTGDTLFGKFILKKVGYESIDVGFVGFPETETRRLGITP